MSNITKKEMREALRRIRSSEQEARIAAERGNSEACYKALEKCQHAAFDAKALFLDDTLEPMEDFSLS